MNRRVAIPVLLLAAAGAAAWWFDAPQRYLGWRKAGENRLTLYGNVDIRQVQLGLRVAGRLAELKFDEGQEVKTGDVLARLDEKPLQAGVRAAEAQVKGQEAILAKLEAGPRPAEIAQARAAVAERKADLDNAKQAFERADRLRLSGSSAQAIVDQAQAQRDMSEARLASASEALKLLLEGSRPEDIAGARANLDNARANLAAAQTSLADATLLAPSDGIILSRVKEPGAIVAPNDIVYVLSLVKPVWVRAYIAEPSLGRVHPGMEVQVVTDTRPQPYRGRVGFISPVAEFTPKTVQTPELRADLVYRMRIIVEDGDDKLRQGMPVTVHLPEAAAR